MNTVIKSGLLESILWRLYLEPIFFIGLILVCVLLYWLHKKEKAKIQFKAVASSILLYGYLCILFKNVVGIPTLHEFMRLSRLGEKILNPNINVIPLVDGLSPGFLLNIFCFIPVGFLSPMINDTYGKIKKSALFGLGLSSIIEISQLFTLYRATDIDDLIANVLGVVLGCCCFKLVRKIPIVNQNREESLSFEKNPAWFLPIAIMGIAFANTFISLL